MRELKGFRHQKIIIKDPTTSVLNKTDVNEVTQHRFLKNWWVFLRFSNSIGFSKTDVEFSLRWIQGQIAPQIWPNSHNLEHKKGINGRLQNQRMMYLLVGSEQQCQTKPKNTRNGDLGLENSWFPQAPSFLSVGGEFLGWMKLHPNPLFIFFVQRVLA